LPCDVLSAFLAFCDRVVYSHYLTESLRFSLSPLQDQECAGAMMWTCATFIYLVPAVIVTIQILSSSETKAAEEAGGVLGAISDRQPGLELPDLGAEVAQ